MNVRKTLRTLRAPGLAWAWMACALLAACFAPSVPDAPLPLPISPLPFPAQAGSPLGAPLPGPRSVGAPTIPIVGRAYIPLISVPIVAEFLPCAQNETALRMAVTFATAPWQQRIRPRCEPLLALAAQRKAEDFARNGYVAHTSPAGVSANANVRSAGWMLPDWYPADGNNVESIAAGYSTVEQVYTAWQSSFLHWRHIAGEHEFFRLQTCFGTAYHYAPGVGFQHYFVLVSAPC